MKVLQKSNWVCSLCNAKIAYDMREIQIRSGNKTIVSMLPHVPTRTIKTKISYVVCPLCGTEHKLKEEFCD